MQQLFFFIVLAELLLSTNDSFAQSPSVCTQASKIVETADRYHYRPRPLDDAFSKDAFDAFVQGLDSDGLLLTQEDRDYLALLGSTIDDNIRDRQCLFLEKATGLFRRRLLATDSLLKTFQQKVFKLDQKDSLVVARDSNYVHRDQWEEKWRKSVKLQMLSSHFSTDSTGHPPSSWLALQESVLSSQICRIQTLLDYPGGVASYVGEAFLKAISFAYDPHTVYFSPTEETEFETLLAKQAMDYGLQLAQNEVGEIIITAIIPGSSAWDSNALNEGDIVLDAQTPQGEVRNFNCVPVQAVARFLADEELAEVSFGIRKPDGQKVRVTLSKKLVEVSDNAIQSFTLQDAQDRKIGYIYLPSFYTNDTDTDQPYALPYGCARDVAKELILLKREGIEGLIFDVRNNGGGSMLEAIRLAGVFIDYGAVVINEARYEPTITLKDMNRGVVYDGPLVILQNSLSASAAELFAAALQDYRRAVVVGSTSFGKATMQQVVPLVGDSPDNATGYLKVTLGNFYRVTGESHQRTGVVPDIKLTSLYDYLPTGERTFATAFNTPPVDKKAYYKPLPDLPLAELQSQSVRRTEVEHNFAQIRQLGEWVARFQNQGKIPLEYHSFRTYYAAGPYAAAKDSTVQSTLEVQRPSYVAEDERTAAFDKKIGEQAVSNIKQDPYIEETYRIIADLIDLLNN